MFACVCATARGLCRLVFFFFFKNFKVQKNSKIVFIVEVFSFLFIQFLVF